MLISRGDLRITGVDFGLRLAGSRALSFGEEFADIVTALLGSSDD